MLFSLSSTPYVHLFFIVLFIPLSTQFFTPFRTHPVTLSFDEFTQSPNPNFSTREWVKPWSKTIQSPKRFRNKLVLASKSVIHSITRKFADFTYYSTIREKVTIRLKIDFCPGGYQEKTRLAMICLKISTMR